MSRHVCYITGTRADFGLMKPTLDCIDQHSGLRLSIVVTGMHLSEQFGGTWREVEAAGFDIRGRVQVSIACGSGLEMAIGIGDMIRGIALVLADLRPDIVLLLGDRGEMLAAAIAAIHLNIPVAHIHGGERSGTVDEPVRHAISKLSHIHLPATNESRERLIGLGEQPSNIITVGAPGLSDLRSRENMSKRELAGTVGFRETAPIGLLLFHPVLQDQQTGKTTMLSIIDELRGRNVQTVALMPNGDAGYSDICSALDTLKDDAGARVFTHLPRPLFLNWMAEADIMIGNSSSGIIEAASFGTPVVNVGDRQKMRDRNVNVIDVGCSKDEIGRGIDTALAKGRFAPTNIFGDGKAADRIADLLSTIDISGNLLDKCNAY